MAGIVSLHLFWILCVFTRCFSEYSCPRGSKIDLDDVRCFWLTSFASTWLEARAVCQRDNKGGDIVLVNSVTAQSFIRNSFKLDAPVWMRNGMMEGLYEDNDQKCTLMSLFSGEWMTEQCNSKHLGICEKQISVTLPSPESYVAGVPLMSGIYTESQVELLASTPDPGPHIVEIMLFPGLWFSHEGRVQFLDMVTQPSDHLTFARMQILRPYCSPSHHLVPPGCSSILNPFSFCSLVPICNTTGGCASGQYWCHLLETCLPVTSPCSPYHTFNSGRVFSLPPRYTVTPPFFHLMADMSLRLPPTTEHTHIRALVADKQIDIYPDDILALQHTRGAGKFLHCSRSTRSAWRQSFISLRGPEWGGWFEGSLSVQPDEGQWLDGVVCDLRVIYQDTAYHYSVSPSPSPSQDESLVSGLRLVHPKLDQNNEIHVIVNVPTLIAIHIVSGDHATSSWSAPVSRKGVPFEFMWPAELPEIESGGLFSHVYVELYSKGEHSLNIKASNSLNFQTLSVKLVSHIPVSGLSIQPKGASRVQVNISQLFSASVASGSSVKYYWVIDDLVQFQHNGDSYGVVFDKPGEHILKVMANNPVSSQSIEVKLRADVMTPLTNLTFLSMQRVVAVKNPILYTIQVTADTSTVVTIRWDFGDNTATVSHTLSPPSEIEDQRASYIHLQDSVHHTFSAPGDYKLQITTYNKYDKIEKTETVKARIPLSKLLVSSSPAVCQVNHSLLFEVSLWPSTFGVLYSWDFGEDSNMVKEDYSKVMHTFKKPGRYNVTICVNNTLSVLSNYTMVEVLDAISDLQLNYSSFTELSSTFEISGRVSTGTHLQWTFDFGDGSILKNQDSSSAFHNYKSTGNYTVRVSAFNSVSEEQQTVNVEIYSLYINKIIPTDCILSQAKIDFKALIKGFIPGLTFQWDFGDGGPTSVIKGAANVTHTFQTPGTYTVSVNVQSMVASAYYETRLCVEVEITNVHLYAAKNAVAVSEEICFDVAVLPKVVEYQFWWHNNFSRDTVPVKGLSHQCFVFQKEGLYEVSVQVDNKASSRGAKTIVLVQRPVSNLSIKYEGNHDAMTVNHSNYFWAVLPGKTVSFLWDFGDGSQMEGQNRSHIFGFAGHFRVTLTASNVISSDSVTVEIEVQAPLSYVILQTPQPFAEAGREILITAQADVEENIVYYWNVNHSSAPKQGPSTYKHVFLHKGVFEIQVIAQNLVSKVENTSKIEVVERIHKVQIVSQGLKSERYFLTNQTVVMEALVTAGSDLSYQWIINQRLASNTKEFLLFTSSPENLYIRLEVSNALGSAHQELSLRSVELVSGVSISSPDKAVAKGKPVGISTSVESGTDLQFSWFLDCDQNPIHSDVPFVQHIFKITGVVNITVLVSNVFGAQVATKLVSVQEIISTVDIQIDGQTQPFLISLNRPLLLHGSAGPGNILHWEWFVTFQDRVIVLADNQTTNYSFVDVGDHQISLKASNDISWQTVSYTITTQDAIEGLVLIASSSIICENDPVTFKISISQGSNVSFYLEFVNISYSVQVSQNFTTSSLAVGNHLVKATARNSISLQAATVSVRVVKRIRDLRLIGCCTGVLEASKNYSFQASAGTEANYHWTFLLNGVESSGEIGQHVHFTPFTNGSLFVTVEADNGFCSQSLTSTVTIQKPVKEVTVLTSQSEAFTDSIINFEAFTDGGSDLKFLWEFGDSREETLATRSNKQVHKYKTAGEFVVTITSFNNISQASTQMTIYVQNLMCSRPQIYMEKDQYKILKSKPSFFEARVDFNGCFAHKASYIWEIFRGHDCSGMNKVLLNNSVDFTTPLLSLPKHALNVGNYCLIFTTRLEGIPLHHNKTIKVNVTHSPLVALIKGGSQRLWSSHGDLILDATESFDPDSEKSNIELFYFKWSYTIENTTSSSLLSALHPDIPGNSSILLFPKSALLPDRVYNFTLTLSKRGRQPASVSQLVKLYNGTLLPITVTCVSCNNLFPVNPNQLVTLAGHCSSCRDTAEYRWSAQNQRGKALSLNDVTASAGSHWREIVIRPGVLMEGQEYTFALNVSEAASGLWGWASTTLVPKRPPYGGFCTLSPDDSLHFLETSVSYSCSGWMDEDGDSAQLIFSLQVAQCEDFRPFCHMITLYRGTLSTYSSLVPLGSPSTLEKSIIQVVVRIEDSVGNAVTAVRKKLTVLLCDKCTMQWLKNKSQTAFGALLQYGNSQTIVQYSIALTSKLNQLKPLSVKELEDKIHLRENVIEGLASLPVSSVTDAALISSALVQSTAAPSEVNSTSCLVKVLQVTEKIIKVLREQRGLGDTNITDTTKNILAVLSSTMMADQRQKSNPSHPSDTSVSALEQIFDLMHSFMLSQTNRGQTQSLAVPKINVLGGWGDPTKHLLCTDPLSNCQFYIPTELSSKLKLEKQEVLQIILEMDNEENPLIPGAEPPISTKLAAMEFATTQGMLIPISNLTTDTAIQVTLHKQEQTEDERLLWRNFTLAHGGSMNFTIKAMNVDLRTGIYIALNFSLIPALNSDEEATGQIWISVNDEQVDAQIEPLHHEELTISLSAETPVLQHTIYLTPLYNGSAKDLFVKVNSSVGGVEVETSVSVCVFSVLCRFFSVSERRWRSDGLVPLSTCSPSTARCLTHHLTMFGASLFIHPEALLLLPPSDEPVRNVMVGIICGVLLLIHLLVGLIAHKLDHLESQRLFWVPLCGQRGCYRYRVLVKTGWRRGSGTTAHVGINLYGLNKSGSRHLQREGAFQRNSMDDFQVETDTNLGEIWKIRIWHDNTGLDPSWYLQHVIVWDIQTDNMFFFLVEDWLSVDNEKNSGRVERVILASCPQELQQFRRILYSQLLFGLREQHLWISLWERPTHSRFSRAQRVTCCALLLHLYLAAGAVWYGAVGRKGSSSSVSTQMMMNPEIVLVGMTAAVLIFPLQTILKVLFQKSKTKVTVDVSMPPSPISDIVEMDVFLSHPNLTCSSFLSLIPTDPSSSRFLSSSQSRNLGSEFWNTPNPGDDCLDQWPSSDSLFGLSELPGTTHLLKRKKAVMQLHLSTPSSDCDTAEPIKSSEEVLRTMSAGEELINTLSSDSEPSDSGHFTPIDTVSSEIQDSSCGEWSDLSLDTSLYEPDFHKSSSTLSVLSEDSTFLPSLPADSTSTISNTRIGVGRGVPDFYLPPWLPCVLHILVAALLCTCLSLVGLYGSRFSNAVVLMWLLSSLSAFLTSALLLEPLAIFFRALYLAVVERPVDPEAEVRLAQDTEVRSTPEDLSGKVLPLCGYGLQQAKEDARKLRTLRTLMRSCFVYLLFLMVVLMVNYQDQVELANSMQIHSSIKHTLVSASPGQPYLTALSGWRETEQWINERLVPHLFENPSLLLVGPARLKKAHFQDSCSPTLRGQLQSGGLPLMLTSPVSSSHSSNPAASAWPKTDSASCLLSQIEEVVLGNNSQSTHQILSDLQTASWMTSGTQAVLVEFSQYHKQTGILAPVSILLDQTQTGRILALISIQPFRISPFSVPDLHVTLTSLLLLFALCSLSSEVWTLIKKPSQDLRRSWCWMELMLALLTLSAAVLRLYFLYVAAACFSRHRSQASSFMDFQSAATLARKSSQLSAILLTLLTLKMVGILQFVRRWLVMGRVIRQVAPQICGVAFILLLFLLLFSHTGTMLFSGSVEGFGAFGQASSSVLSLIKGRTALRQLCKSHPVMGTLYCLSAVGLGFWILSRLCVSVLIRAYQIAQKDIYRAPMVPQDYEMVQFLMKRFKLWMGLSKTKEFRHRVKFEGMLSAPSRSSRMSDISSCSTPLSSLDSLQTPSFPSSPTSESSLVSDSCEIHQNVDRLVPCVEKLLSSFERVNQVTEEVYNFELQLERIQSKIAQRRKLLQEVNSAEHDQTQKPTAIFRHPSASVLECKPALGAHHDTHSFRRATNSESSLMGPGVQLEKRILSALDRGMNSPNSRTKGSPRRRAWNSVTCHSADTAQRFAGFHNTHALTARSLREERDWLHGCAGIPIKRHAWQTD